jgi:hypothetical protein
MAGNLEDNEASALLRMILQRAVGDERQEFGTFFLSRVLGFDVSYVGEQCVVAFEAVAPLLNPQGTFHGGILATAMPAGLPRGPQHWHCAQSPPCSLSTLWKDGFRSHRPFFGVECLTWTREEFAQRMTAQAAEPCNDVRDRRSTRAIGAPGSTAAANPMRIPGSGRRSRAIGGRQ